MPQPTVLEKFAIEPNDNQWFFRVNGDPSASPGLTAQINSVCQNVGVATLDWYQKTGAGDTAWTKLSPNYPNLQISGFFYESATDVITAFSTGGQTSAVLLTTEINRVGTVAAAGDSVKLPVVTVGKPLSIVVINHGANAMQVFGSGTDTVNDVATATGVSQMPGSTVIYTTAATASPAAWYTESLANGFASGFATQSFAGGLIAHAGGGQGSALPLTAMVNRVVTVGTAADSVLLPATTAALSIGPLTVVNAAATNSMNVFPAVGDAINALAANAAFAVAAGKTATFYSCGAGQWHAVLSA